MVQFNREKMRAAILRICHSCRPSELGAVKLNKTLYYLDMIFYAHHRQVVAGGTYRKRPNGPTCDQLLFELRAMERAGEIEIRNVDYHGYLKKEYVARVPEPETVLNDEERALLDDVIEFVCRQNTAKSISEYSHSLPWDITEMGDQISYRLAILLFPTQPSPEAFELAKMGACEFEEARSSGSSVVLANVGSFRDRLRKKAGFA